MFGSRLFKTRLPTIKAAKTLPDPSKRPPISALLVDISGNLHIDRTPTPGAIEAFQRVVSSGIPFRLCSNTSKESTADLIRRLDDIGFPISDAKKVLEGSESKGDGQPRLVWTSIGAVSALLKDLGCNEPYLLLSDSARTEVLTALGAEPNPEKFDSVVIGLAPSQFDYEHLNTAFRILKGELNSSTSSSSQPPLLATHRAKYVQAGDGMLSLGPGPFVTALENAVGPNCKTHVVGKPESTFFEMVIEDFGDISATTQDSPARVAIIGDDIEADLGGGAIELGLWRVLVKTGKYRPGDECREGMTPPDEVHDSFASFVATLLSEYN